MDNLPASPTANLVFNLDGTLPPEALASLPDEVRARVTSPEFREQARKRIRQARRNDGLLAVGGRRESAIEPIRFHPSAPGPNRKQRRAMRKQGAC